MRRQSSDQLKALPFFETDLPRARAAAWAARNVQAPGSRGARARNVVASAGTGIKAEDVPRGGGGGGRPVICDTPSGVEALERMAARLDADALLPYPLRVGVLDHGMLNAVALPGGRILIFRGLLEVADNPEEVAGVLARRAALIAAERAGRS